MRARRSLLLPAFALVVPLLAPAGAWSLANKVMFVSSALGNGNLATWAQAGGHTGLAAGDAICQSLALSAGLANPSLYRAWLSTSTTDAFCHVAGYGGKVSANCGQATLPNAGPWVRTDGKPFSYRLQVLVGAHTVLWVPRYDENGATVTVTHSVFSGTGAAGTAYGNNCNGWQSSSASDYASLGQDDAGAVGWTDWSGTTCDHTAHLFCFESGLGDSLPAFALPGAYVFVTAEHGNGDLGSWPQAGLHSGLAAGDAICRSVAEAHHLPAASNYVAWLSTSTTDAKDRLVVAGPWRRPDGPRIAANKTELTSGAIQSAIETDDQGGHGDVFTVTGTGSDGTASGRDCNGWTSASASDLMSGGWSHAAGFFWTEGAGGPCDGTNLHLYCFANRIVLFADGFESGSTSAWSSSVP